IACGPAGDGCGNPIDCGPCATCSCDATDINGNPVHSDVCGSTICGQDSEVYSCTKDGYLDTGASCGSMGTSCAAKYQGQGGIQLCLESTTECTLESVNDGTRSCDDVCNAGGGTCLRVYGNNSSNPCAPTGEKPGACGVITGSYDDLCVCSL